MQKSKIFDLYVSYEKDFKAKMGTQRNADESALSSKKSEEDLAPHEAADRQQKIRF